MHNEQKFRQLLQHAWHNSRYYRETYTAAGVTAADLDHIAITDLPVMTKSSLMVHFNDAVTDDRLKIEDLKTYFEQDLNPQNFYLDEYVLVASSAGSDISSYVPYTLPEWRYFTTEAALSLLPGPLPGHKPVRSAFYFATQGHWVSTTNVSLASRSYHDILRLSIQDPVELVWARLNAFNPQRLSTYASSIAWLVDWTRDGKLAITPQTVLVSGDKLTPFYREKIKELWGSEIYDLYASVEAIYAAVKKPGETVYKVFKELVLLEVVDQHQQSVKEGERGRVLVTNLVQKTLPLIRFDLYDYATLGKSNFGAESLLSFDGKSFDTLLVRSEGGGVDRIHAYELVQIQVPGLKRIQFISHSPDHFEALYLSDHIMDREVEAAIQTTLHTRKAAVSRVEVRRVDHLFNGRGTKFYNVMNPGGRFVELNSLSADPIPNQIIQPSPQIQGLEILAQHEGVPLHEAFQSLSQHFGAELAVESPEEAITYHELDALSTIVAHNLLECSFDRTIPVAIYYHHNPVMIVLILGVLKAGGFFLPLDPNLPTLRIKRILEDTQPQFLLTDQGNDEPDWGSLGLGLTALPVETILHPSSNHRPLPRVAVEAPTCLIYTSGSTGIPQGFVLSHQTILSRAKRYIEDYHITPSSKLSLLQSYSVSAGIREIFGALLGGATLSMYDLAEAGMKQLPSWVQQSGITHLYIVPTVWRLFLETVTDEDFSALRSIRLGGEAVRLTDLEGFKELGLTRCTFANGYAATETGTICQYFMDHTTVTPSGDIPVGFPVKGASVQILSNDDHEKAFTLGEIVVHGDTLAIGSWDPLKKQVLPFKKDTFPTGDLGFRLQDGRIFLTERNDRLIKVHGLRVDLNEIENTAKAMDGVAEAAAVVDPTETETITIALFYVVEPGVHMEPMDLQNALRLRLPNQAVPKRIQQLSEIPRLTSGKWNPSTFFFHLPAPTLHEGKEIAYKNQTERRLAEIWKDVLHLDRVSPEDDFIALGGDSIMVFRVQNRIWEQYHIQISVREFFDVSQFSAMADWINRNGQLA